MIKRILFLIMLFVFVSVHASASDVTVVWDINLDADYYIVYWGNSSGEYTNNSGRIDAVTYTITDVDNRKGYTAVKAFNSYGNSSGFSDEITYEVNVIPVADTTGYKVTTIDLSEVK